MNHLPIAILATSLSLCGCGGASVIKDPAPLEIGRPLAEAADSRVAVSIEAVMVPNRPGAWAKNADWDEYLLRVRALSEEQIVVTDVAVFDALDNRNGWRAERSELVDGARETERRYEKSGKLVKAGSGGGWMIAGGTAVLVTGVTAGTAAAMGSVMAAGAGGAGMGAVAVLGTVTFVGGAVLIGAGVVRLINNAEVNAEIKRRQSVFPVKVARAQDVRLTTFFPLTPLPRRVEVTYIDSRGEQRLHIDTQQALSQLHLDPPAPPPPTPEPAKSIDYFEHMRKNIRER